MNIKIDTSKLRTAETKLLERKQAKIASLSAACRQAITADFLCDALGEPHWYPQKETDQLNLASSVLDSTLAQDQSQWTSPFWCATEEGVWDFRIHTATQLQQVGALSKARILALMAKNKGLADRVAMAETIEDVDRISWEQADTD